MQMPPQAPAPQPQQQSPQVAQPQQRDYNQQILPLIEQHLNTLPKEQQQYLHQYLTPELAILFGIVMGQEALDYFKKFVDPNKMLVVQPRKSEHGGQQHNMANSANNKQPQPQQQSNPPQANIMGV